MRPVEGFGCNKNGAPNRKDLPMHDQTGGNYWFANMTQYQDANNILRLGGGLTGNQILAMDLGQQRAVKHLQQAGDHLDRQLDELYKRSNVIRQEEIIEEIEVILLSAELVSPVGMVEH